MKKSAAPLPHDGLFKTFLTHPDTARDFLDIHLPDALRQICDLNTLQLESGSFIEENLRAYYADVLYSLKTTRGDGYVYCLVEHQSSPDKLMAFRLLRYAVAAMHSHLENGHQQLPLVIPVLFCHGRASPWRGTLNWIELFSEPEAARQLYSGNFPLVDVGALADDDIMTHRRMAMLELLLKHARQRDMAELINQLVTLLLDGYTGNEQVSALLNWMLQTGNTAEPEAFLHELARRAPDYEETMMTIAEYLEQKGWEKGMQLGEKKGRAEGREEGREEGRQEEALKIAAAMLKSGFDRATIMKVTNLSEDILNQLSH